MINKKKLLIKAIFGFITWIVGLFILFNVDFKIAIGVLLVTLAIYWDLKTLMKYPELLR